MSAKLKLDRVLFIILVFCISAVLAADQRQDKPSTPAEIYQALLKEQQNGSEDLAKARTPEERKQVQARLATLPLRFVEFAEGNPKDPAALDALLQAMATLNGSIFPAGGKDTPGERALALVLQDHLRSEKLGV